MVNITREWLRDHEACSRAIDDIAEKWPGIDRDGVLLNSQTVMLLCQPEFMLPSIYLVWLIDRLAPDKGSRIMQRVRMECNVAKGPCICPVMMQATLLKWLRNYVGREASDE